MNNRENDAIYYILSQLDNKRQAQNRIAYMDNDIWMV